MNKDSIINEIISNFNFFKVKVVMHELNWKWQRNADFKTIPSIIEMEEVARDLLNDVIENGTTKKKNHSSATGGFRAEFNYNDQCTKLMFILEESEIYGDV